MDNRENSYSQAFKQIAKTANSPLPLKNVLNSAAKSAAKALKAAGCSIMLLNPQKEHFDIIAAYGLSDLYLRKGALKASESLPEALNGKLVAIFDVSRDERRSAGPRHRCPSQADLEEIQMSSAAESTGSIGVAVVGAGYWGPNLIRNFWTCPSTRVVAVCDTDRARLDTVLANYPSVDSVEDFDGLAERSDVEAVAIATPIRTHAPIALAAIRSGMDVGIRIKEEP